MNIDKAKLLASELEFASAGKLANVIGSLENESNKLKMEIGSLHTKYDSDIARPLVESLANIMKLITTLKLMKANA